MSCYLKVFGRVRPSASGSNETALHVIDKNHVKVEGDGGKAGRVYELHRIFPSESSQEEVFSSVAKKLVEECTEGINGTIFAYGQTGSGKTHTMLGPSDSWSDAHGKGLIPRSIEHLFDQLEKKAESCQKFTFKVNVEFVELYNEEIFDLLSAQSSSKIILRDIGNDIVLSGSTSESVDNSLDLMTIVKKGWQSRRTGATAMNRDSSRSHALLIIKITTDEVTGDLCTTRTSTLNLVDLAGSERQSHTKATGDRLKEATNINSSLTVLGRCIRMLAKPSSAQSFVPYRDSYLTHILKNSLGGNSKTAVIVNMHPDRAFLNESASTLLFAETCTMIKNKVLRNEVMTGDQENSYKKAIQQLRQEVEETRAKARKEFAKRLEDSDEHQHRLTAELATLKTENTELRSKYNLGLLKYLVDQNTNELPSHIEEAYKAIESENDLVSKCKTLTLENGANEKRCQELQEDRDSATERLLNNTLNFQTPRVKKRQSSSRNPRRETIYQPSPAIAEASDSEALQESEHRVATLEVEVQTLKNRLEKTMEDLYKEQLAREEAVLLLEAKLEKSNAENEELIADNEDLKSKVVGGRQMLDNLLLRISSNDVEIVNLKAEKAQMEEKFSKEVDELRNHYVAKQNELREKLAESEKKCEEAKTKLEILEKEIADREQMIARMEADGKESASSSIAELQQLQSALKEKDLELEQKIYEIGQKTALITQLESSLERSGSSMAEVRKLKSDLKEASIREEDLKCSLRRAVVNLQESQKNEEQLQKIIDAHKKATDEQWDSYQTDIRNMKIKSEEAVKDKEISLENAKKALALQKKTAEQQKTEANSKFEEKMASFKQLFDDQKKTEIEQREEEVRRELKKEIKQIRVQYETDICLLQKKVEVLEKQFQDDSTIINAQLGSRKDKLSYVDKVRQKAVDLEAANAKLLQENARLRSGKDSEPKGRVLRSRNPV